MTMLIVLALIAAGTFYAVHAYNSLVRHRNLVAEGWSGIDVQLKRRADLIPSLVETVKGYAAHEQAVFRELVELRNRAQTSATVVEAAAAGQAMSQALGRLFALAEAYPQLKADANFRALQEELAHVEDELQMARRYYNGTVRNYNTMIEQAPSNLIARNFSFSAAPFFELDDPAARQAPQVRLDR